VGDHIYAEPTTRLELGLGEFPKKLGEYPLVGYRNKCIRNRNCCVRLSRANNQWAMGLRQSQSWKAAGNVPAVVELGMEALPTLSR
jgi:hypothetical protein